MRGLCELRRSGLCILHLVSLTGTSAFGGPSTVALDSCEALRQRGHAATVASGRLGKTSSVAPSGAKTFRAWRVPGLGLAGIVTPGLFVWLWGAIRGFDVVHVHAGRDLFTLMTLIVAWVRRKPFIIQTHGMFPRADSLVKRTVDRVAFRPLIREGCTAQLALNSHEVDELLSLGVEPARIVPISNGVPVNALPRWQPPALPRVAFIARLHPRKRVKDFLDAASLVLQLLPGDPEFVIAGPDEGDLTMVRGRLADPALRGRVSYLGELSRQEALQVMATSSIFVLPSVEEPFPVTLLEALAIGVPSVCTTGCRLAPQLTANGAAEVVPPGPEGVAGAIQALLTDPARASELGRRGTATARTLFSIDKVAQDLENLYVAGRARHD